MRRCFLPAVLLALALSLLAPPSFAQAVPGADSDAILQMLNRQAADWNRGDLDAFASGYKNSPDILFMGQPIRRGYEQMLNGYRKSFPNRAAMGTLTFSNLQVQPLDPHFATATGRFHLARTAASGGDLGGFYLLVLEKTPAGWKIVRDDTTRDDPPSRH